MLESLECLHLVYAHMLLIWIGYPYGISGILDLLSIFCTTHLAVHYDISFHWNMHAPVWHHHIEINVKTSWFHLFQVIHYSLPESLEEYVQVHLILNIWFFGRIFKKKMLFTYEINITLCVGDWACWKGWEVVLLPSTFW